MAGVAIITEARIGVKDRDVCPVGAIYPDDRVPDGTAAIEYDADHPNTGHDHRYFIELSRSVCAD